MYYKAEILTSGNVRELGVFKTRDEAIKALMLAEKDLTSDNYQAITTPCDSDGMNVALKIR